MISAKTLGLVNVGVNSVSALLFTVRAAFKML